MSEDAQNGGWLVRHSLLRRTDLTFGEKLVMAVVLGLERKKGCCCGNDYIAEQIGTTAGSVRNIVAELRRKGLLEPNTVQFGKPFSGPRLVSIKEGGAEKVRGGAEILRGGALFGTQMGDIWENDGRESRKALTGFGIPESSAIATRLVELGFDRQEALEEFERQVANRRLTANGLGSVQDWVALTETALRRRQARAKREASSGGGFRRPAQEAPKSQFRNG